ncbi:hypothetical protein Q7O_004228 [Pectobacterium carotovorum subsp. carotovorum PCCS1]|jgi:hypothetical protein|nr:hypothetical protein [Pectobacterium carotovorum subsp. carotovorum PCCS1]
MAFSSVFTRYQCRHIPLRQHGCAGVFLSKEFLFFSVLAGFFK